MDYKRMRLLDWVDKYPESEPIIKKYDGDVGCCLLCQCLFDTIEEIEMNYQVNLNALVNELLNVLPID